MKNITAQNLIENLKATYDSLSPMQKRVAGFIVTNYPKAAFLTADQIAKHVGVSQPTVTRLCQHLGLSGYPELIDLLQKRVRFELTSADRYELSLADPDDPAVESFAAEPPIRILQQEAEILHSLAESFPMDDFNRALSAIVAADRVFIAGMRAGAAMAEYFAYLLRKVKRPVHTLTNGGTCDYDKLMEKAPGDLGVVIAFPRYPREALEAARFMSEEGMPVLAITDSHESPLAALAQYTLPIPMRLTTLFGSHVAAFCVFNILVTEVGREASQTSQQLLQNFEHLERRLKIFVKPQQNKGDSNKS